MRRVLLAPAGIPKDRLDKLRTAMAELQKDKTYLSLIKAIGETHDFIDGATYDKMRPKQRMEYKKLVESLAGK